MANDAIAEAAGNGMRTKARRAASRSRAGNDQERRMIEVAAHMFAEKGYDATSVQDIADDLGILKGSLYHYIDSKDDLLWAVISKQHETAMSLAERCEAMDDTPRAKLSAFIDGYVQSLAKEQVFATVYLQDVNALSPERRAIVVDGRTRYHRFVADTLKQGQAIGQFRQDLIPAVTANALLGMLTSTFRWYRAGTRYAPKTVIAQCKALILDGVNQDTD
jgi:AcrR family transcriptional regulator